MSEVKVEVAAPFITLVIEAMDNKEIKWEKPPESILKSDVVKFLSSQDESLVKHLGDLSKIKLLQWGSEISDDTRVEIIPGENVFFLEVVGATSSKKNISVICGGDRFTIPANSSLSLKEVLDYAKSRSNPIDAGKSKTRVNIISEGRVIPNITDRKTIVNPGEQVEIQIETDGKA